MILNLIKSEMPLFYYSFTQVRVKETDSSEVHAANKITIRKHKEFNEKGLEILVYNCALSKTPELCEGIRYTRLDSIANDRINFYGKGVSGNGVSLTNRFGSLFCGNNMFEFAYGRTDYKNIYVYHNFYKSYGKDVFKINEDGIKEFLFTSMQFTSKENPIWSIIRAFVLDYYGKIYGWSYKSLPFISESEWIYKNDVVELYDKYSILKQLEILCDEKVYDAYQDYRKGNLVVFKEKLENMCSLLGTYYVLYNTLQ